MILRKEVLNKMVLEIQEKLEQNRILEKFWKRKVSGGEKNLMQDLGKIQNDIKMHEEYLTYLYEEIDATEGSEPKEAGEEVDESA